MCRFKGLLIALITCAVIVAGLDYRVMAGIQPLYGYAPTLGDYKSSAKLLDHSGWILLDGRLKNTLSATQQSVCASLGGGFALGGNLPDATGRAFIQGNRGVKIGSTTIALANLPNVTLSGSTDSQGSHTHSATVTFHDNTGDGFNGGRIQSTDRNPSRVQSNASEVAIQSAGLHSHNVSVNLGGSGTAYMPAGIGANQFVYLGF
jgi:hypothetical protein